MLTNHNLVDKGYFPKELPPPFITKKLATSLNSISAISITKNDSRYCKFSMPRLRNFRRILAIPNPAHQLKLCDTIVTNWTEIKNHYSKSSMSLTKPTENADGRCLGPEHEISDIKYWRINGSTDARYLLHTDVSRYYSTIYTHSIPWAMHTKQSAKRTRDDSLLGNRLDKHLRNTQYGQTMGIPIGPDTSLVISEIIGTALDELLLNTIKNLSGFRYIDDYYLYFKSKSEAEETITNLQSIFREYELELSSDKTTIYELPEPIDSRWAYKIRSYKFEDGEKNQRSNLIDYFSEAFEYSKLYPNDFAIKYSVSRIRQMYIYESAWDIYEALILKCLMSDASLLPIITEIFVAYESKGYSLNKERISNTICEILFYSARTNSHFETAWGLWLCKSLRIQINKTVAQAISAVDNSIVALLSLDMLNSGLISNDLNYSAWSALCSNKDDLYSENWLLAYEAPKKGWISPSNDYIAQDPFFSALRSNDVEFYDTAKVSNVLEIARPGDEISDDTKKTYF